MTEFIQQNVFLVVLALTSGGMIVWSFLQSGNALTPAEATLKINRDEAVVIDVRDTAEWNAGRIPGARHIAMDQLAKRLPELEKFKERPVVIYCATGNRSASACGVLKKAGFTLVFNLDGGLPAWREANLPVTTK
jgi:rhodanese-related sulfurtransferase